MQYRGWQTPVKTQIVNILGFVVTVSDACLKKKKKKKHKKKLFKNVKTILSSWAIEKQMAVWIWPVGGSFLTSIVHGMTMHF